MKSCLILVGHGGVPKNCPAALVSEFKRLEAGCPPGQPSAALERADRALRDWPRTPETDPYKTGLEAIAAQLRRQLSDRLVLEAYNEFCAPSLEQALASAAEQGARAITVISTMYTRGGVHSEAEIPAILARFRKAHPDLEIRYAWPFSLPAVAEFLAAEIARAEKTATLR